MFGIRKKSGSSSTSSDSRKRMGSKRGVQRPGVKEQSPPKEDTIVETGLGADPVVEAPVTKSKIELVQDQVDQVVDIMRDNLKSIQEREGKLEDMENRVDKMSEGSKLFNKRGKDLMDKAKAENRRMKKYCIFVTAIFATILIALIIYFTLH